MFRIKELRKEKKMSQKEFSDRIGIDNSQLSKIEQGKLMPTLTQLLEISSIFEVSLDWLTGKENNKSVQEIETQNNDKYVTLLEEKLEDKQKQITLLEENKALLLAENERLKAEIEALKSTPNVAVNQFNQPTQSKSFVQPR